MKDLSPKKIVEELDRFIIGQKNAKKSVAIALRNRWRRKNVPEIIREEILPKNILMIGPTGVGKTEISRRIAKLTNAPFVKIEATKFTEIGYVGRDVDSIIRDLTDISVNMVRQSSHKIVEDKAHQKAEERILSALVGEDSSSETKSKFRDMLRAGTLGDKEVEVDVIDNPASTSSFDIPGMPGSQMGVLNISDILGKAIGNKTKLKKMTVNDAYKVLIHEESEKLVDEDKIIKDAITIVENDGIVFLDEVDKIVTNQSQRGEVSREGVQRDLLPLIEGTTVSTKYGPVKTDHILFIASGAFHMAKPSDMLPELQGRLPIRVELDALSEEDLINILNEPEASLLKQYSALIDTESVRLEFHKDGVDEIARIAADVNKNVENIGARRLHTIMEKLLEEISFTASDIEDGTVIDINKEFVEKHLADISTNTDLSKFIL